MINAAIMSEMKSMSDHHDTVAPRVSVHRYVREGTHDANWGCGGIDAVDFEAGES